MGTKCVWRIGWFCRRAAVLLVVLVPACADGTPSKQSAEEALLSVVDGGSSERFNLGSFAKTDGRLGQVMGTPIYTMMFVAEGEFTTNAMFSLGRPLVNEGTSITTREYQPPGRGFSWADWFSGASGFRPAMEGDRLQLAGEIGFEKRESGWVATAIAFTVAHDSSGRVMRPPQAAQGQTQQVGVAQFLGIWNSDYYPIVEIADAGAPGRVRIRACWGADAADGIEMFGKYVDGRIVAEGSSGSFYKAEVPTFELDGNTLVYQHGAGPDKLTRALVPMPKATFRPPVCCS